MTCEWTEIMGRDPYELQLGAGAGEAVAKWLKHKHPTNTAKMVARAADLDPRTAENILDGHLSGITITRLLRAYKWALGKHLVAAVVGETYEQSVQREIEEIAHDRRELEERERANRSAWALLHARGSLDGPHLRLVSEGDLDASGEGGGRLGEVGAGPAVNPAPQVGRGARR